MRSCTHIRQSGFTLFEISVVLVIVALVIGGILVGGDMIRAAELRSIHLRFSEKIQSAIYAFPEKIRLLARRLSPRRELLGH
jgi:prepilin-type N-terminal cleavage/methylation domain-containing protein